MKPESKIFIAGARGLAGSAIIRRLEESGYTQLLCPGHAELELMDPAAVLNYFKKHAPEYVILAAARVGGILANSTYPAEFIYENLMIQNNIIHQSWVHGVRKLIFLGSSCVYPKHCPQPIREDHLMTGPLEPTNSAYALAKIAGIEMCWAYNRQYGTAFIPVMPTNLYGPNDNFDLKTSHVLSALIRKFHEAKKSRTDFVTIWGSGSPRREFLYADDLADACLFLLNKEIDVKDPLTPPLFNIGTGKEITIKDLAEMIREICGCECEIRFDASKPDGTPRKLLDVSRMKALSWEAETNLRSGIEKTYQWYINNG
ncbi:MAG: GDP-L-fucose synthase [Proteobacteria bacterium]|nr:GDP-L-fucose synthase [Desulfobacula sp.]MBU4131268.1 GDP-L-fucose synthase [Pseudomonadota bacterium]